DWSWRRLSPPRRRSQDNPADAGSAHAKAAAEKRLNIHPARRDNNEPRVETVFLERAGRMDHPDAGDSEIEYGIGKAKSSGQHRAHATRPEYHHWLERLFHGGKATSENSVWHH